MKKSLSLSFGLGVCLLLISSCKNFFNGGDFLAELEESVEYSSSPYVNVTIATEILATKSIEPSAGTYEGKYKKGNSLTLNFEEKPEYEFTYWTVEPSDSVTFSDAEFRKTTAVITAQEGDIKISPAVYKRPEITVSPSNVLAVAKNTAVVIEFDHVMSILPEQINSISIKMGTQNLCSNFNTPQVTHLNNKTQITFIPLRDNLITLEGSEAKIDVNIPKGFYYTTEDGYNIATTSDTIYTYSINNQTLTHANITVPASDFGTLSFTGSKTFYLDDVLKVTFTPKQEKIITGWSIYYDDGATVPNYVDPSIVSITPIETNKVIEVKLLTGSETPIIISPVCEDAFFIEAAFDPTYGTITPSETQKLFSNTQLPLSFHEDKGYVFLNWQFINKTTGKVLSSEEIENLFEINIEENEQSIKIKELSANYKIKITAQAAERIQVLSVTPTNSQNGTSRDSRIQIMFDHAIDENSIYFDKNERAEIISRYQPETVTFTPEIDPNNDSDDIKCYAYTVNNQVYYKNITVIDYRTGKSLLNYFDKPVFETSSVLSIPSNKTNLLLPGTQVFVTIEPGMYYKQNGKTITMAGSKKWNYWVNSDTDTTPPTLTITEFKKSNWEENPIYSDIETSEAEITSVPDFNKDSYYAKLTNFQLNLTLLDTGSGPGTLKAELHNLSAENNNYATIVIPMTVLGTTGYYGDYSTGILKSTTLDLSGAPDFNYNGYISVRFLGSDVSGHEVTSDYYYFYSDVTGPGDTQNICSGVTNTEISIYWSNPTTDPEYNGTYIKYREKSTSNSFSEIILNKDSSRAHFNSETIYNLPFKHSTTYEFYIGSIDYYGNIGNLFLIEQATAPAPINEFEINHSNISSNNISISWIIPTTGKYDGIEIQCCATSNFENNVKSLKIFDKTQNTANIPINDNDYPEECYIRIEPFYTETIYNEGQNKKLTFYANFSEIQNAGLYKLGQSITSNLDDNKILLSWEIPETNELNNTIIRYREKGTTIYSEVKIPVPNNSITLSTLSNGTSLKNAQLYELQLLMETKQGITGVPSILELFTLPKQAELLNYTEYTKDGKINFNFEELTSDHDGIFVYYSDEEDFSINNSYRYVFKKDTLDYSKDLSNSFKGKITYFKFVTYIKNPLNPEQLVESNISDTYTIRYPEKIKFTATSECISPTQLKLSWNAESNSDINEVQIFYKERLKTSYNLLTTLSPTTKNYYAENLKTGYTYDFKFIPLTNLSNSKTTVSTTSNSVLEISSHTQPENVVNITATAPAEKTIKYTWEYPENSSYDGVRITYKYNNDSTYEYFYNKEDTTAIVTSFHDNKPLNNNATYSININTFVLNESNEKIYSKNSLNCNCKTLPVIKKFKYLWFEDNKYTLCCELDFTKSDEIVPTGFYIYKKNITDNTYSETPIIKANYSREFANLQNYNGEVFDLLVVPYFNQDGIEIIGKGEEIRINLGIPEPEDIKVVFDTESKIYKITWTYNTNRKNIDCFKIYEKNINETEYLNNYHIVDLRNNINNKTEYDLPGEVGEKKDYLIVPIFRNNKGTGKSIQFGLPSKINVNNSKCTVTSTTTTLYYYSLDNKDYDGINIYIKDEATNDLIYLQTGLKDSCLIENLTPNKSYTFILFPYFNCNGLIIERFDISESGQKIGTNYTFRTNNE